MRLDKFLKVSRIVKRRTVANEMTSKGRVHINERPAKAGTQVKKGDRITIRFGYGTTTIEVLDIADNVRKAEAESLYRIIKKENDPDN